MSNSIPTYLHPPNVFWEGRNPLKLETSCSNLTFPDLNTPALLPLQQVTIYVSARQLECGPAETERPGHAVPRETIMTVTGAQQQIGKGSGVVFILHRVG